MQWTFIGRKNIIVHYSTSELHFFKKTLLNYFTHFFLFWTHGDVKECHQRIWNLFETHVMKSFPGEIKREVGKTKSTFSHWETQTKTFGNREKEGDLMKTYIER